MRKQKRIVNIGGVKIGGDNPYCAIEKCHNIFLLKFEIVLRIKKALRTTGIKTGRKA